jgi:hypothetical protein
MAQSLCRDSTTRPGHRANVFLHVESYPAMFHIRRALNYCWEWDCHKMLSAFRFVKPLSLTGLPIIPALYAAALITSPVTTANGACKESRPLPRSKVRGKLGCFCCSRLPPRPYSSGQSHVAASHGIIHALDSLALASVALQSATATDTRSTVANPLLR